MKTWTQIIQHVQKQKIERNWTKLYWCIDLHDTIITGKYNKFNEGATIFPYAKETLDFLYNSNDNVITLWTSSYYGAMIDITNRFGLKFHHFNVNPGCPSTDLCDFKRKLYFNFATTKCNARFQALESIEVYFNRSKTGNVQS